MLQMSIDADARNPKHLGQFALGPTQTHAQAIGDSLAVASRNSEQALGKPSGQVDGDIGYIVSREARYAGTPVRKAFDTYANPPEFELYDLQNDPFEMTNQISNPSSQNTIQRLKAELTQVRFDLDETDERYPEIKAIIDAH